MSSRPPVCSAAKCFNVVRKKDRGGSVNIIKDFYIKNPLPLALYKNENDQSIQCLKNETLLKHFLQAVGYTV